MIISISGITASGKSTVTNTLIKHLFPNAVLLNYTVEPDHHFEDDTFYIIDNYIGFQHDVQLIENALYFYLHIDIDTAKERLWNRVQEYDKNMKIHKDKLDSLADAGSLTKIDGTQNLQKVITDIVKHIQHTFADFETHLSQAFMLAKSIFSDNSG